MRLILVTSALLVLIAVAGCQGVAPHPMIPVTADVASVHLMSIGSSLNQVYDVTLTKEPDIAALVAWLKQINWSPSRADDLRGVKLAYVGEITVTLKDGTTRSYHLSGGSIIVDHWMWPANTDALADIAKQGDAKLPSATPEEAAEG